MNYWKLLFRRTSDFFAFINQRSFEQQVDDKMPDKIIDRDTYRSIKKMSREELQGFLMRYAENLTKDSPVIDLQKLEWDIKSIKGIGEKRLEAIMVIIEKHIDV